MSLDQTIADDLRLAPEFEEYLVCKVYLEQLEETMKPETSTLRSAVRTRLKSIRRKLIISASRTHDITDEDAIGRAATLILQRHPVGKAYYLSMLPDA